MRWLLLSLAALALTVPGHALAARCSNTDPDALPVETPLGTFYVVNDLCQTDPTDPCVFSVWIYQESNGIPGLQRSDEVVDDVATTDKHACPGDTDVF